MRFEMKCEVCGQGPQSGVTIFRTGGKGEGVNPHWRCEPHAGAQIDPETWNAVALIEQATQQQEGV